MFELIVRLTLFILLHIHIICIFINYGMIYAYLQRYDQSKARALIIEHTAYALMYASSGMPGIFAVMRMTNFPKYGFKILPVEILPLNGIWAVKEMEAVHKSKRIAYAARKISNSTGGRCDSIW